MKPLPVKIILSKWLFIFISILVFTFTGLQEWAIAISALIFCNIGFQKDIELINENNLDRITKILNLYSEMLSKVTDELPDAATIKTEKIKKH
jgi:hypothetical protein